MGGGGLINSQGHENAAGNGVFIIRINVLLWHSSGKLYVIGIEKYLA